MAQAGLAVNSHWFQTLTRKQQNDILSAAVAVVRWTGHIEGKRRAAYPGSFVVAEEAKKLRAAFLSAGADIEEYT